MSPLKLIAPLAFAAVMAFGFQSKPTPKAAAAPKKPAAPTFKDIQPIFHDNCFDCHTGTHPRAGIDFSSYDTVMDGGEDGPIIKKGAPKHSLLIQALRGLNGVRHMPPRGPALAEEKIVRIEKWIADGAKP